MSRLLLALTLLAACDAPSRQPEQPDAGPPPVPDAAPPPPCLDGVTRCDGNDLQSCQDGAFVTTASCPAACDAHLGCVACVPGSEQCSGETTRFCRDDGSGYDDPVACDPLQGSSCDAASGHCVGPCVPSALGRSYIGCEYYPTVIGNAVANTFDFAIAVANATDEPASVTLEGGSLAAPELVTVAPASVQVVLLPWVDALKLCSDPSRLGCYTFPARGARVADGAYHLRSTRPVTVYQFNPLEYSKGGEFSYSNDASLLLPVNAWGQSYVAAAWPHEDLDEFLGHGQTWPSLVAVTAAFDQTTVSIDARASTEAWQDVPACTPGTATEVVLDAGDVIEIAAFGALGQQPHADLTGSAIHADKPVQVVSGSFCSDVPVGFYACDHLEESMLPVEVLGTRYLVTSPAVPALPDGKQELVRIVATQADTALAYDPPQPGAAATLAAPGDFVELPSQAADVLISADKKVLVVQYMEGQEVGGETGDPSMALAVPVDQYRSSYLFHAPLNYKTNYVNVTAPVGSDVRLDGAPVVGFTAIGTTGYQVARVIVVASADGNHVITGSAPFGISVYGYGDATSYWYPGGLDLSVIP